MTTSCYCWSWRSLHRRTNAGIVWVSAPGDYALFNSNHIPDGTSLVVRRREQEADRPRLSPPGLACRDRGGLARSASTWSREMTALTAGFGDAASWVLTVSKMP